MLVRFFYAAKISDTYDFGLRMNSNEFNCLLKQQLNFTNSSIISGIP